MNEFDYIKNYFLPLTGKEARFLKDDAAIIEGGKEFDYVISTDTLVEKVHFYGNEHPKHIAQKSLRVNLSDLAAMGASPLYYNLSLSLPKLNSNNFIKQFVKGLKADQKRYKISLIGGDLTSSNKYINITITIIGSISKGKAISRSGACKGDNLYVTGVLGLSSIGCKYFKSTNDELSVAKKKYLLPEPRINFGKQLCNIASSMIDVSDGLIQDASHLAKNSNLGINLKLNQIPVPKFKSISYKQKIKFALNGGDDYELLFSSMPKNEKFIFELGKKHKIKISKIGKFTLDHIGKVKNDTTLIENKSYKHF